MFVQILSTLSESDLAAVMWSLVDLDILPDQEYPEYHVPFSIQQCSDILESRFVTLQDILESRFVTLQDILQYLELRRTFKLTQAESDLWNDLMIGSSDPLVGF
jgi:hypothetical protein